MKKVMILFIILLVSILCIKSRVKNELNGVNVQHIKSDKTIILPNNNTNNKITCTGLFYDKKMNVFYIGNAGKELPEEKTFQATIEIISNDFKKVIKTIECYKFFPKMKDIQGVTGGINETLWFCSYGENKVKNIDINGNLIFEFNVKQPSGIAFDTKNKNLWILTNKKLINYTVEGNKIKSYPVKIKGQDQIYLDEKSNILYITAGIDYQKESYIYSVNLKNGNISLVCSLTDSFAIEGISIVGNDLYILNDGYYHKAKLPFNQINIYKNFNKIFYNEK